MSTPERCIIDGIAMAEKSIKARKSVPLRIDSKLYNEIAAWAEDEFRSVNGQIEYLLSEAIKQRKNTKKGDS